MFAYTHCTHLFKHIRKPQRKPHRHHLVSSRWTVVIPIRRGCVRGNFHCRLLPFNWLGDFSVLSRYPRVIVSIVACPLFTPFPLHSCSHNLAPSILTGRKWSWWCLRHLYPTNDIVTLTGIHRRHAREPGRKVGCDVSILTSFISQKYARCVRTHLFITLIAVHPPPQRPHQLSPKHFAFKIYPSLQLMIWLWYCLFFFFLEQKCVSDATVKFLIDYIIK